MSAPRTAPPIDVGAELAPVTVLYQEGRFAMELTRAGEICMAMRGEEGQLVDDVLLEQLLSREDVRRLYARLELYLDGRYELTTFGRDVLRMDACSPSTSAAAAAAVHAPRSRILP